MTRNHYDAVVVGAGHNGLVAASYLAKAGMSVLVLERLDKVGGACTTDEVFPGFFAPMCARGCYLLQGRVVDDLGLRERGLEMVDPNQWMANGSRLYPFPDGTYRGGPGVGGPLDVADQIRQFSEHDARAYFRWEAFWDEAAGIFFPHMLREPPTISELYEEVRGTIKEEVLKKVLTWSYLDLLDEHIEDEHVRTRYMGLTDADPRSKGSLLWNAIQSSSRFTRPDISGAPVGNMGAITQAMANAAESFGVEIRTRCAVQGLIVENGKATGVRLSSGEEVSSSIVVSNADPKRTYSTLVRPEDAPEDARRAHEMKSNTCSLHLHAALKELPDLSRYMGAGYDRRTACNPTIAPSVEYYLQSFDDAESGRWSRHPIISIQIPSVLDPSLAPRGIHVAAIWVMYEPPRLKEGSRADAREEVGEYIIDMINEYAPNFRESIVQWSLQTPEDIETRVGLTDGNIRHLDAIPDQLLSQRLPYRTQIEGFYLCGAGTHPGGEVTGAPGHNAAHAILKDVGGRSHS